MKETILLYHIADQDRLHAIQRELLPVGMRIRMVKKEEYLQPVGFLAGVKEIQSGTEQYEGEELEKEMMVMAGLSSGQIDAVLMALRRSGAGRIDYKAVLTPTNSQWDSLTLYRELSREHAVMSGQEPPEEQ